MLKDAKQISMLIEGTYKKLKTYYYYDKTLLHIKRSIVEFEGSSDFQKKLSILSKKVCENDIDFFMALIEKVNVVVFPKTLTSQDKDEKIIKGTVDKNKKISKVNFSIDAPVEMLILDMLWGLFIKKIYMTTYGEFNNSYAGEFKKGLFNSDENLVNGIDFASNRCFEPYFQCYSKWRNKALDTVIERCKIEDVVMLSLDLKSFYYSVEFDFEELEVIFGKDERYREIEFFTKVVKELYKKYTKLVSRYKKGIGKKDEKNILPIGLISPIIIRDIILSSIDNNFIEALQPRYYGRYVDDILLVVNIEEGKEIISDKIIHDILIKKGIVSKKKQSTEYEFTLRPSIKLQSEKINCFLFEKGKDNILVDVYYKQIKKSSSESNLLPDVDVLSESFNNNAYAMNSSDDTGKIRNLEFLESDNYRATIFINGLKRVLKNASYNKKDIEKYLIDIMKFYSGSQAIEFSNTWRTIFELMILCKDKKRANEFYANIKSEIQNLSFDCIQESEIFSTKKNIVLHKLQNSLIEKLDMAIALALALDFNSGKLKKHRELAKKIRHSNMINHNMVSFPLINYSTDESIDTIALINMNLSEVLSDLSLRKKLFLLDSEKLRWSPRFIHLSELYYCIFYFNVGSDMSLVREEHSKIFDRYIKYNALSEKIPNPIQKQEEKEFIDFNISRMDVELIDISFERERKIGLVNTQIYENDVLDSLLHPEKGISIEKKQKLYKMLNIAKEEGVKYLVFPEFYMPALWLSDIGEFLKRHGVTIITGLQYIVCENRAYNIVCVIESTCGKSYFRNTIPFFREKNFYAPDEKIELAALGYRCREPKKKIYYLLGNKNEKFSTILCFEFTDICSRAVMKGFVDFLCVPQLNRDTNYFSSIVESASRDLHTIVVQANTSIYGDSRITGPYKTAHRDVLKIKGGENDIIIVGRLGLKELHDFRKKYQEDYDSQVETCMKCRKIHSVEQLEKNCLKCKNRKGKIKGLPPNWK